VTTFLQFAVLGLGPGAMYALLGQGLVVIYKGAGVLNFSQGAMAMLGAFIYSDQRSDGHGFVLGLCVAVLAVSMIAVATHLVLMWRLRDAPPLVKAVITLGVFTGLEGTALIVWHNDPVFVTETLPSNTVTIDRISIGADRLWLVGITLTLTIVLWSVYRYTTIGMATRALAEDQVAARALGWSAGLIGGLNWAVSGGLAAIAGILIAPVGGLQVTSTSLLVVPALGAALIGGFSSFPLTLVGGLIIGASESLLLRYVHVVGFAETAPLVAILLMLIVRGRLIPQRGEFNDRLPRVGRGGVQPMIMIPAAALGVVVIIISPTALQAALGSTLVLALFLLSLVVVVGYAGQLSLAQFALGGVGAFAAAKLIEDESWPFLFAILAGVVVAGVAGIIFGIPALRTRGVQLAVVTICVGYGIQQMLFANSDYTGGATTGLTVGRANLFGLDFSQDYHPQAFAIVALAAFAISAIAVATMRDSRVGRRLLAVRSNERAATGVGVSVTGSKLYAFALSSGVAGLAGCLLAFEHSTIYFGTVFDPFSSILIVSFIVLGGVGYIPGALLGAILGVDALASYVGTQIFGSNFDQYLTPIGGFGLVLMMSVYRDGQASLLVDQARSVWPFGKTRSSSERPAVELPSLRPVRNELEVKGVSVRYGAHVVVDDVSFGVASGEVLGIIGANGAGKTTILDCITGYAPHFAGDITINGSSMIHWNPRRRVHAGVSRSFQSLELFEDLSVRDNLRVACERQDLLSYATTLFRSGNTALPSDVVSLVEEFGLQSELEKMPTDLSYGRRRLVAVARAMATRPAVLLLDEPAAGLGDEERAELHSVIVRLRDSWGVAVVLVEHDVDFVLRTCSRVVALDFGKVIATGPPQDVRQNEAVVSAYLGGAAEPDEAVTSGAGHSNAGSEAALGSGGV
jgi:ABC-type branched-subunit amino acid transport system ATPase component/branched-subunit amino acid ABC-type transport system permease component